MKTTATLLKMKSFGFLAIFSLALSACGSYSGVSYYSNDGVYSTPRKTVYEVPVNSTLSQKNSSADQNTQNPNEFGSYFSERANTYADLLTDEVITSADQYVGSGNYASAEGQESFNTQALAAWGGNPSKITVEVYNNPWFDYFYPGNPEAMWGYQGLYFNSLSRASFGGRWGLSAGWGNNPWGFNRFGWAADPWGFGFNNMGFGFNNWGWNNWGFGGNRWNNWGWGGWAFNNPSIYYGPYNYNRVQRYVRNNRFNPRSRYRTSYAINATRRGKSNAPRKRTSAYALRKNSLSVNGLRSYLRTSDNTRVVDAYRNNTAVNTRNRNSISGNLNNTASLRANGRTTNTTTASNGLRNSSSYTSSSVRNNSLARTPRATRSSSAVRSTQTLGNQMYRNLSPNRTNYRSSNSQATNNIRAVSPIRRTPNASNTGVSNSSRSTVRNSNYRSTPSRSSSSVKSSAPSRSSSSVRSSSSSSRSSSSSTRSSSSSSRRSSGRNN